MQTVRAISSVDLSAPQYPSPADEGYHLLIDRLTGALIVHVRDGVSLDGADAEGDALTVNPIVMGGKDSNGDVRALAVSTDGRMLVNLDNATIVGGNIFVELDSSTDSVEVLQATHDNLNLNANLQVGDADVGGGNPVPISASSLPLPAGASTSAKQDDVIAQLTEILGLQIERYAHIDEASDASSWAAGTDVANLTDYTTTFIPHEDNQSCISFDKTGTTVTAALVSKTTGPLDFSAWDGPFIIQLPLYHANYTNIQTVGLRLGTDASNYHEWLVDSSMLNTGSWDIVQFTQSNFTSVAGTGVDMSAVTYIAVVANVTAVGNTFSNLLFDEIQILSAPHSNAIIGSEVSTVVNTANMNIQRVAGSAAGVAGAGTVAGGTQRVTLASNDGPMAALLAELQAKADLTETQPTSDSGPAWTDSRANISSADLTSATDLTAAPTSNQKIVVTDLIVSVGTAMRVDFIEETTGTVVLSVFLPADGTVPVTTRGKFKLDTANKKLRAQASAAGNIRIFCLYHSEA